MDKDLLKQSLTYHGDSLFAHLKCEQIENPDFNSILADLSKITYDRKDGVGEGSNLVEQFIARKADILFAPSWKCAAATEVWDLEDDEAAEPYAVMPPLELFMEVSYEERKNLLYRDIERGDAVIGRINNIRDFGFFLTLLCMAGGLERDIEDLELTALCPIRDVPSNGNHDDPLSYYQIGDLIRAGVKDLDRYHEKITVSLQPSSLSSCLASMKLGVMTREELPVHYSRSMRVTNDTRETYERVLKSCHGYHNPSVVEYVLGKVGISDTRPPSVMRGLQSKHFLEEDFATAIRKKQSTSWALKCVRSGVDHFKHGRHVEAMNEYNKALEIDTNNTEALVARGALYATKGSLVKAIGDFELALKSCPSHRNAKKYLCQTLVERGGQLEEEDKLVTAEGLYRRALSLDDTYPEAKAALGKITFLIQKSIKLREEAAAAAAKEEERAKNSNTSAEKLRKILKEEKRMKKKHKRSTSSSSSCSSSSRRSSSSSLRKSKKRRRKRRRSSLSSRRRRSASSRDERRSEGDERGKGRNEEEEEEEEEEEWYSPPANTSASFLNQRDGVAQRGQGEWEGEDGSKASASRISQLYSLSPFTITKAAHSKTERSDDSGTSSEDDLGSLGSEHSRKVDQPSGSKWSDSDSRYAPGSVDSHVLKHKPASRRSLDSGRYESGGREEKRERLEESRAGRRSDGGDYRPAGALSRNGQGSDAVARGPQKEMPANLLDIFSQIAQFQKEKGVQPKK
ncbi:tetratricopeptide repeat protein 14 [Aplochiton taeniatus]